MRPLHKLGFVGKFAKSMVPLAASSVTALHMEEVLRYAEAGAALLQGKGSGSGWDLDAEVRAAAACIHRPDPVLFDIGANYGKWARGIVQLFPATQKLILFEPQEECVTALGKLDLPGKVIVPCAVADRPGSQTFFVGTQGWAAASFYERAETCFSEVRQRQINVPVTTIDEVVEKEKIQFVDFAKFDIEGAELSALRGGARTFRRQAIGALSIEFGSGNINSRTFFRDFWDFLTGHGFELFRVLPGGRMLRIEGYYEDLEHFRGVSNYVARGRTTGASALFGSGGQLDASSVRRK